MDNNLLITILLIGIFLMVFSQTELFEDMMGYDDDDDDDETKVVTTYPGWWGYDYGYYPGWYNRRRFWGWRNPRRRFWRRVRSYDRPNRDRDRDRDSD